MHTFWDYFSSILQKNVFSEHIHKLSRNTVSEFFKRTVIYYDWQLQYWRFHTRFRLWIRSDSGFLNIQLKACFTSMCIWLTLASVYLAVKKKWCKCLNCIIFHIAWYSHKKKLFYWLFLCAIRVKPWCLMLRLWLYGWRRLLGICVIKCCK